MSSTFEPEPHQEGNFHAFYEGWLSKQNQNLEDLIKGLQKKQDNGDHHEAFLTSLVDGVMKHYQQYYNAKSQLANQDVLLILSPPWKSSLEEAFHWIGGWRPSMAFQLLYSKSGLQLEACFGELLRGLSLGSNGDLGDLSRRQLIMVDKLQQRTVQEERHISGKMAKLQGTIADSTMVEMSHVITEMMRSNNGREEAKQEEDHMEQVGSTLDCKERGLEKILHRADDLRMSTLKNITNILSPVQAVHFLIAAAELHLRLHDWGKKKDASRRN